MDAVREHEEMYRAVENANQILEAMPRLMVLAFTLGACFGAWVAHMLGAG